MLGRYRPNLDSYVSETLITYTRAMVVNIAPSTGRKLHQILVSVVMK